MSAALRDGAPAAGRAAAPSWSLARRLTLWSTVVTVFLGAAVWTGGTLFLRAAVARELDALVAEEFDELNALFAGRRATAEALAQAVAQLGEHHAEHDLTWGIWSRASGKLLAKVGPGALPQEEVPAPMPARAVRVLEDGRRWRTEALQGFMVGISLTGGPQVRLLRRFTVLFGVVVMAAAGLAMLAGSLFGRRVAGELRRIAEDARTVRSPDGELARRPGAPEEIRRVVDALREMLSNIRSQAEQARVVTAGMAHELRSPIQNLLGECEVALLRERDGEFYRGVLQKNLDELRELARAVDNLVMLCGAREVGTPRELERFDLGREADLRLERERHQAERRGVRVELRASGDLSLHGDREALLLALRNLVSNAIDWSPPGGTVTVELRGGSEALELVVEDRGPGVPADERQAIFEPFRRGRAATGRRVGYGLGLALVKSTVETHGGSVDVADGSQGGARFRVRLPRGRGGAAA